MRKVRRSVKRVRGVVLAWVLCFSMAFPLHAFVAPPEARADLPPSLKTIAVPEPEGLSEFVRDRNGAVMLGKALFWDMQLGSDGKVACATCHYHAGSDHRTFNQTNPGTMAGDDTFQITRGELQVSNFPLHRRTLPERKDSAVIFDTNDVIGSQGVRKVEFLDIVPGQAEEMGTALPDPVFSVNGVNARQVVGRNAPSVFNSVFNFANFHDGRANNVFNGVNPFGAADLDAVVFVSARGQSLQQVKYRIAGASVASQSLGPPVSSVEMSYEGRTWPKIGKKMLSLRPLAKQLVHPEDSSLGQLSKAKLFRGQVTGQPGLRTTYDKMIRDAFWPKFWDSPDTLKFTDNRAERVQRTLRRQVGTATDEYTHMEANFSLFFGFSVQMYLSTLISDDSRYDRYMEGLVQFTPQEEAGLEVFFNQGRCNLCHNGSLFSNAVSVPDPAEGPVLNLIELMPMINGLAFYDGGYYNVAVTRTSDDIGRGGTDPFGYPLSFSALAAMKRAGTLPPELAAFVQDLPGGNFPVKVDGSFKTSSLRNVDLTGPYFHNGSMATLAQTVDFYIRGGNFPNENIDFLSPFIFEIRSIQDRHDIKDALVAFMLTLTDERVKWEQAPFDHPQIFIPERHDATLPGLPDIMEEIPAVGAKGRAAEGLPPLGAFLEVDHFAP